jgi:hypothetical protein
LRKQVEMRRSYPHAIAVSTHNTELVSKLGERNMREQKIR